jgi:hypothetical protein
MDNEDDLQIDDMDEIEKGKEDEYFNKDSDNELKEGDKKEGSDEEEEEEEEDVKNIHWAVKVIRSTPFVVISLVCILGNTCVLAMDRYRNTDS